MNIDFLSLIFAGLFSLLLLAIYEKAKQRDLNKKKNEYYKRELIEIKKHAKNNYKIVLDNRRDYLNNKEKLPLPYKFDTDYLRNLLMNNQLSMEPDQSDIIRYLHATNEYYKHFFDELIDDARNDRCGGENTASQCGHILACCKTMHYLARIALNEEELIQGHDGTNKEAAIIEKEIDDERPLPNLGE